jgi:hypothetical protein
MDDVLLAKLDAIKESLHDMNLKLDRIEEWRKMSEPKISDLEARMVKLEALQEQAKGAANAGKVIWALLVFLAGAAGWVANEMGIHIGRK